MLRRTVSGDIFETIARAILGWQNFSHAMAVVFGDFDDPGGQNILRHQVSMVTRGADGSSMTIFSPGALMVAVPLATTFPC